jgi:hypothetical protein
MPMHWRRILDGTAFLLAVGTVFWMRYGGRSAWWAAIVVGLLVFAFVPFIASRLLAKHLIRRMERAAAEIPELVRLPPGWARLATKPLPWIGHDGEHYRNCPCLAGKGARRQRRQTEDRDGL